MVILKKRGPIRLELSPETDEANAVAVTITPISQANVDVAMGAITTGITRMEDSAAFLARYGVETGEHAADALRMALRVGDAMLAIELGIRHITAWEGVAIAGDGGAETTAPLDPAGVAMLFNEWAPAAPSLVPGKSEPRESYGARFMRRINALTTLEPGAKKGSGASPDGASGAAPTTAGVVAS